MAFDLDDEELEATRRLNGVGSMSEEEKSIIFIRHYLQDDTGVFGISKKDIGLLFNLYQQEKEKNKWRTISEYDKQKHDWVLVKYFDGDYECVPEVAEKRSDGKWYTSEKEIPFEVKYFFDMQNILKE